MGQLRVKLIGKGRRHKDGERAKVSLREVVEVAKAFEATTVTNQLMKTARETQEYEQVNYSNYSTRQKQISRDPCYWCNSKHKQPRQKFCPVYSKRYNKCGTLGHFSRVCRSSGNIAKVGKSTCHHSNSNNNNMQINLRSKTIMQMRNYSL